MGRKKKKRIAAAKLHTVTLKSVSFGAARRYVVTQHHNQYNIFSVLLHCYSLLLESRLRNSDGVLEYHFWGTRTRNPWYSVNTRTRKSMYSVKKSAEYTSTFGFR